MLQNYYSELLSTGVVSAEEFPFSKLLADYRTFGFAHLVALEGANWQYSDQVALAAQLEIFYAYNNLTVGEMKPPMFGWW